MRKNWRGGGQSLLKNRTIDGYWLRLLNMLFTGWIYIAHGRGHLGDFCNIFLPNIPGNLGHQSGDLGLPGCQLVN